MEAGMLIQSPLSFGEKPWYKSNHGINCISTIREGLFLAIHIVIEVDVSNLVFFPFRVAFYSLKFILATFHISILK